MLLSWILARLGAELEAMEQSQKRLWDQDPLPIASWCSAGCRHSYHICGYSIIASCLHPSQHSRGSDSRLALGGGGLRGGGGGGSVGGAFTNAARGGTRETGGEGAGRTIGGGSLRRIHSDESFEAQSHARRESLHTHSYPRARSPLNACRTTTGTRAHTRTHTHVLSLPQPLCVAFRF
jgi:hypothetical protein